MVIAWNFSGFVIVRIKFNFHVIFSVIIFFTTIYCFDFVFNSMQNICVFFSSALFSLPESWKIKYLFPFFFKTAICMINKQIKKIFTINISTIIIFFNCDVSNVKNINPFVMLFDYFSQVWVKIFEIDHVVVKIISSIFDLYLFEFSHL